MRDFVGHDAGEFGLFLGAEDQAAVDVEEAAGEGEGVDLVGVDHLDGEGHAGVGVADEVLADTVDVFGDDGVINELGGLLDFLGELLAEANFAFEGVQVDPFANAAVADGFDVFLGILGLDRLLLRDGLEGPWLDLWRQAVPWRDPSVDPWGDPGFAEGRRPERPRGRLPRLASGRAAESIAYRVPPPTHEYTPRNGRAGTCNASFTTMLDGAGRFPIPREEAQFEVGARRERSRWREAGEGNAVLRLDECVPGVLEAVDTLGGAL